MCSFLLCPWSNSQTNINAAVGLTSRYLIIPISERQDTVGPLARTVKDAAHVLQAIAGVDSNDNYTSAIPDGVVPDYLAACKSSALSGVRLGIPRNVMSLRSNQMNGPMITAFEQSLAVLRAAGATIVENTNFTAAAEFQDSNLPAVVSRADFVVNLSSYLGSLTSNPNNITSLADLRKFTQASPLEGFPTRDTAIWDAALQNWNNTDPRFWLAYQQILYYGSDGGLLGAIERNDLDAVILPSITAPDWAAALGAPIITVPLGFYSADVPVVNNSWGLVESAPNIPYVNT